MKKKWTLGILVLGGVLAQGLGLMRTHNDWGTVYAKSLADTQAQVLGVYFSPSGGAADGIAAAIDASQHEVLVQAYSFTHQGIAQALVRARARGVSVQVLVDEKSEPTNRRVLTLLNQGHIPWRADGQHAIAHNKVMVIDNQVVVSGSYNFTQAAEVHNAENCLILKSTELAHHYKAEWQSHWAHSQ